MSVATAEQRQGSKTISVFLFVIGIAALGISMWMNFRFGWGLSGDLADRTTLAVLHVLVDPAAAGLVVAGTLMRRWGWRMEGLGFQIIAILLILYSMLSVYGFMSARIAMTTSHDAVIAMQKGQLDWTRNSSVNRELPKVERRLLRQEAKELTKEIGRSLAIIPDAQAASIATAIGVSVDKVQRALVMISSGIAQAMKFVCLLAGVMIWPRAKQADSTTDASSGGGGDKSDKRKLELVKPTAAKLSGLSARDNTRLSRLSEELSELSPDACARMPFLEYDALLREHAMGLRPHTSQRQLAKLTGRTQQAVQARLKKINRQLEATRDKLSATTTAARGFPGMARAYHAPACG
jgi:hypothetical protein